MDQEKELLLSNEQPVGFEREPAPYSPEKGSISNNAGNQLGMYSQLGPVVVQPVAGRVGAPASYPMVNPAAFSGWMPMPPQQIPDCPPGLEYLTTIDQLLVHQKVELLEVFTGFETQNQYTVKNSLGQKVFHAGEQSDCCSRNCCGAARPFEMSIVDNFQREVIRLVRPLRCQSCFFPCCLQVMEVFSPAGCLIGSVEQKWSLCVPEFAIKNAAGDTVLRIEGPCLTCNCCGDVEFNVMSKDSDTVVGRISKQWSGLVKELFTDADNFGVTFPIDLDVRMKAVMLGACFLIDMMYFENKGGRSQGEQNAECGCAMLLSCLRAAAS